MSDIDYIVRDLQQRMANMIRRGRVHSVDFSLEPPRVRVEYEPDVQTDWLPFISGRASQEKTEWEPLAIGEQVIIFSEGGSLSCGIVVPALHDSKNSVPSRSPDEHVTRYQDGTTFTYSRKTHTLSIDVQGDVNFHVTGNVTSYIEGNMSAQVDGTADITVEKATTVKTDATLHVESAQDLSIKTSANMALEASGNVDIKAGGNVKVTGSRVDLN
ncbi:TPA: phage baseplate assembly protein V [Vibrio cholerae]|nr:phage baseplate assembly protein V [Vibrio cholerae]HDI3318801.1 phage baseplate assembly protein V [Vibrio cholerae]